MDRFLSFSPRGSERVAVEDSTPGRSERTQREAARSRILLLSRIQKAPKGRPSADTSADGSPTRSWGGTLRKPENLRLRVFS